MTQFGFLLNVRDLFLDFARGVFCIEFGEVRSNLNLESLSLVLETNSPSFHCIAVNLSLCDRLCMTALLIGNRLIIIIIIIIIIISIFVDSGGRVLWKFQHKQQ